MDCFLLKWFPLCLHSILPLPFLELSYDLIANDSLVPSGGPCDFLDETPFLGADKIAHIELLSYAFPPCSLPQLPWSQIVYLRIVYGVECAVVSS